jgi:hypothetical protein
VLECDDLHLPVGEGVALQLQRLQKQRIDELINVLDGNTLVIELIELHGLALASRLLVPTQGQKRFLRLLVDLLLQSLVLEEVELTVVAVARQVDAVDAVVQNHED